MSRESGNPAEEIFSAAMAIDEAGRVDYVRDACGENEDLCALVFDLLDAARRADGYLGHLADRIGVAAVLGSGSEPPPREHVGPFRLVRLIGRGGMGAVYLGERSDDQFEQQVAIKIQSGGVSADTWLSRFLAERQILARINHPNIARLLDGGITEDGLPYFVMELIEGLPITAHCREYQLDLEERLDLFLQVCEAVEYAHQNLVVHRDIKPSNVLVSSTGAVKLLDFGIAKLIEPHTGEQVVTGTGFAPMTPRYASPEMVGGEPVTTASDVYSLGVLLYELLTGQSPYGDIDQAMELWHVIRERQPLRASEAAATPRSPDVAPPVMAARLRGDLDVILSKALEKNPHERYGSVAELSLDIRRHQSKEPISARAPSYSYRLKKFVRRYRPLVVSSAAAFLLLVAVATLATRHAVVTTRQAAELARAREHAELLGQRALDEAAVATEVIDFVVTLFESSLPERSQGAEITAREMLDRGAARVRDNPGLRPEVRGKLLGTMSNAYRELGLFEPALELALEDLELQRSRATGPSAAVAGALATVGVLHRRLGRLAEAERFGREAVQNFQASSTPSLEKHARALIELGATEWRRGRLTQARTSLSQALSIQQEQLGLDNCDVGSTINGLAILSWQEGDTTAAIAGYRRALALCESELGPQHPKTAHTLNNLSVALLQAGEVDEARTLQERALAVRRAILDPAHPDIGESLNNLSHILLRAGDFAGAKAHAARALEIRERALGETHDHVAASLVNLGTAMVHLGEVAAARPLLERALSILEGNLGPDHPDITYPLLALARADAVSGNLSRARKRLGRVVALREEAWGEDHPETLQAKRDLQDLLGDTFENRGEPRAFAR